MPPTSSGGCARGPGEAPPVVVDATGAPAAIRAAVDLVSSAGRVAVVGMGPGDAARGSLTAKEIDVLGVSICQREEFAAAVALVAREGERRAR